MDDEKSAEQDWTDDAEIRSPDSEDNECYCKPASVAECVIRPDSAGIIHNVVKSAEACDNTAFSLICSVIPAINYLVSV